MCDQNTLWSLLNYDHAEIASLEEVFPDIQVFYVILIVSSLGTGNWSSGNCFTL